MTSPSPIRKKQKKEVIVQGLGEEAYLQASGYLWFNILESHWEALI
jgi:hypothetical protein